MFNIKNRVIKNASWIIGGRIAQMLLSFIINSIIARYLGVSNYGVINYTASYITFFMSLCTLGLNIVIIKEFVGKKEDESTILGTAILMRLIVSIISIGIINILFFIIPSNDESIRGVAFIQSISLLFYSFDIVLYWYQYKLESKKTAIIQFCAYFAMTIYRVVIIIFKKNIYWFAFANTLDIVIVAILYITIYRHDNGNKFSFSFNVSRNLIKQSYPFIISGLMISVYTQVDKIMIGIFMDSNAVGLYAVAATLCGLVAFIPSAIIDSARPVIMNHKEKNLPSYEIRVKQLYAVIIWFSLLFSLIMTLLAEVVILVIYGSQYEGAVPIFQVLVWYSAFSYLGAAKNIWLICEGKSKYEQAFTLGGAISNVILNFILIPNLGIIGAAIASLITQAVSNFIIPLLFRDTRRNSILMIEAFFLKGLSLKN